MARHVFTKEECRLGGNARSIMAAYQRRIHPTPFEKQAQDLLEKAGWLWMSEFPVQLDNHLCFVDIIGWKDGTSPIWIEIDGSHGWHKEGKRAYFDELKARFAEAHNIPLIFVTQRGGLDDLIQRMEAAYGKETIDCSVECHGPAPV